MRTVSAVAASINGLQHEMIFVNDDSSDKSAELLMALQDKNPITTINMSWRLGVTPCVPAGFAHARGDAVVYMDADL